MIDRSLDETAKRPALRRLAAAPAAHFAAAGLALFLLAGIRGAPNEARGALVVPRARFDEALRTFEASHHRPPGPAEIAVLERRVLDEEVLLQHALDLGLDDQEPVRRRMAMVAEFVGETPEAASARDLGRDDMVIRRLLVDAASRLIRGAVTTREPSRQALEAFLAAHPERFARPEEVAISIVPEDRAGASEELPLLTRRELALRFGRDFAEAVDPDADGWQGPVASREGSIRFRVRAWQPSRAATVEEAGEALRAEVREATSERWLALRTAELRAEMGARVDGSTDVPHPEGGRS